MSEESLEVLRRIDDAFSRRDVEAIVAEHHPDAELNMLRSSVEGSYRGHDGIRQMYRELFELVPDFEVQIDHVNDYGDHVLTLGRQRGTMRGAGFDHVFA